ncbi:TOM complex component [Micractinium conductrix]|uniref:TOM complex component n=1 Tax=Micractinium conductrix TaxID=554055 RepID=A0A2P6V6R8_9CHLO|nr:TOM complex component [Micractinium conductrix]PSC69819.1 TOM complex component [Micractinium conductrix]|eukprot:PSC69782.1 TOM complex component [Micractinium conductrix]
MAIPPVVEQQLERVQAAWVAVRPYAKIALHWGYIPAIIAAGMLTTEPRPSLAQLLGPM